ncbi:MAG: glycosyltransferase family 2 protein [Planctomycetes bacterium]|nr:glycosyltransferase family 2 protein [Planctomycetota bacterium]
MTTPTVTPVLDPVRPAAASLPAAGAMPASTAPPPLPISAVIITFNAAAHIDEVLRSLAMCDERLVLDSGSTDGTVAIARAAGARVEHQPFLGYGLQKRRAVVLATHDWILSLDADEILDAEAQTACRHLDLANPSHCWSIWRRTFVGQREIRHGAWRGERVLRLFNRRTAGFKAFAVHESVESQHAPRLLNGSILHFGFTDCRDVLARSLRYAPLKAGIMRSNGQMARVWMLPLRGLAAFLKSYVLRSGWRDGAVGYVIAIGRVIDSVLPRAMLIMGDADIAAPAPVSAAAPDVLPASIDTAPVK